MPSLVECTVQPNGTLAAAHRHPNQSERFEVESGTVSPVTGFSLDEHGLEAVRGAEGDQLLGEVRLPLVHVDLNVAWKFRVYQRQTNGTWKQFPEVKLTGSGVPSYIHLTAAQAAGTHRYRIRAGNPVGWSQASNVRDPSTGLDITG